MDDPENKMTDDQTSYWSSMSDEMLATAYLIPHAYKCAEEGLYVREFVLREAARRLLKIESWPD